MILTSQNNILKVDATGEGQRYDIRSLSYQSIDDVILLASDKGVDVVTNSREIMHLEHSIISSFNGQSVDSNTDLFDMIFGAWGGSQSNLGTTSTESFVNESNTSVLLTASDINRKKLVIINESNRNFFMSFNSPAVLQQGIVMAPGDMWVEEHYTGAVYGVWSSGANKGARIFVIK